MELVPIPVDTRTLEEVILRTKDRIVIDSVSQRVHETLINVLREKESLEMLMRLVEEKKRALDASARLP